MENDSTTYANFGQRLFAFIIDFLVLFVATSIVWLIFQLPIPDRHTDLFGALVLFVNPFGSIFSWLYYAIMESSKHQGTFGKMAMSIRVGNRNGERISFMNATGRFFGKFISSFLLGIGYFMIIFTKQRQALHDIMASTYLIKKTNPNVEHNSVLKPTSEISMSTNDYPPDYTKDRIKLKELFTSGVLNETEYENKMLLLNNKEMQEKKEFLIDQELKRGAELAKLIENEAIVKSQPDIAKLEELKQLGIFSEEEFHSKCAQVIEAKKNEIMKIKTLHQSQQQKDEPIVFTPIDRTVDKDILIREIKTGKKSWITQQEWNELENNGQAKLFQMATKSNLKAKEEQNFWVGVIGVVLWIAIFIILLIWQSTSR